MAVGHYYWEEVYEIEQRVKHNSQEKCAHRFGYCGSGEGFCTPSKRVGPAGRPPRPSRPPSPGRPDLAQVISALYLYSFLCLCLWLVMASFVLFGFSSYKESV